MVLTLTVVFTAILLLVAVISISAAGAFGIAIAAGCVLLLLWSWAHAPTAYRVDAGELVVVRPAGSYRIPLAGLQHVSRENPRRRLRIVGWRNGGLFGVYGRMRARGDGWLWFSGRQIGNTVLLQFSDRSVLVMPDDPDALIDAINEAMR